MSEKAQTQALAAAHSASEAIAGLITYGRDGGPVDASDHYDMVYPLARGLFLAMTAAIDGGRAPDDSDGQLMAALSKWIEA